MHNGMSLAAHDDKVGPLLGSRLLQLGRRIAGTNPERPRRHMADMHGCEFGTEVRGEPSCHPGGLDAAVGAIDTENDSLHRYTSPSSRQPPGGWRPAHLMASSSTTRQPLLTLRSEPAARDRQAPACRTDRPRQLAISSS